MFTLQFGDYTFPNQTFEVRSFGLTNTMKENAIPRSHGGVVLTPYLKSRTIKVKGKIHNASAEDTLTELLAMQAAMLVQEPQWFKYRSDRAIKALVSSFDNDPMLGTDRKVMDCELTLKCPSPFFYSAGLSYSDGFTVTGTTYSFDVFSGGNVFAEPVVHLYPTGGTITDSIKLINNSDGSTFFRFRGTLPAGQTLRLDSEDLTVLVGSIDGMSDFEGDFTRLVAGTNSFTYVGGNVRLTVEHKYRWYN